MEINSFKSGQNIALDVSANPNVRSKETNFSAAQLQDANSLSLLERASKDDAQQSTQVNVKDADKANSVGTSVDVNEAVEEVQSFLQAQNRNLAFTIDDETKRAVVTVKDGKSGDVIRQIPSEEVLRLAERIKDLHEDVGSSVGILFNNEA